MQFAKIIGQEKIKQRLIKSVTENRVSHAQLFSGPSGTGKLALTIAYAQYLSCTNRTEKDSCGECLSCKKYEKLIHPDLHFVFPVATSKNNTKPISDNHIHEWRDTVNDSPYITINQWINKISTDNKQGLINVHESSEILKKLHLKTFESEYKIMIIWQSDKMNATAANKLLKLIEEPPPNTIFLLTTENQQQLLKTILSRTQIIAIPGIDNKSLTNRLISEFGISEEDSKNFVHLSSGSYITARNYILENEQNLDNFNYFAQLMRLAYKKDVIELQKWVDEIAKLGRVKQKSLLEYSLQLIRENFMYNSQPKEISFLTGEELKFSAKFSPFIKEENITSLYQEFNNAHYHIDRNGYSKLIFFDLSLKLIKLLRV